MSENSFKRSGQDNSKIPTQEDAELEKMAGEIHSADDVKRWEKRLKEIKAYFKDLGLQRGDQVEFRPGDGSRVEGEIKYFNARHSGDDLNPDDFVAGIVRAEGGYLISISPKDVREGRVKKL